MEVQEVSLDEMWKVIESFGIKRDMLQNSHPTDEQVRELYQAIKKSARPKK